MDKPVEGAVLESVAFVGESLASFFLVDPSKSADHAVYGAFRELDAERAAAEWPFGRQGELARGLAALVRGLREESLEALSWEFRRLFVGPGHKAAAPWGSVYTDHDGVIFGETELALRAWMRSVGISGSGNGKEPEDHMGLMLFLMAWIARNKPELLVEYLQNHLFTWSSHYLEKLEREAELPFYEGLAVVTRESLEGIQASLEIEVALPRYFR